MIQAIRKRMNQKGFTLVELMVVIAILGVLAAIAIPKFSAATASANTAKIQADLRTIESAIVMAQAAGVQGTGTDKAYQLSDLDSFFQETPKPPTGSCYLGSSDETPITETAYTITNGRATLGKWTIENIGKNGTEPKD